MNNRRVLPRWESEANPYQILGALDELLSQKEQSKTDSARLVTYCFISSFFKNTGKSGNQYTDYC